MSEGRLTGTFPVKRGSLTASAMVSYASARLVPSSAPAAFLST